jgi:hypothetical protein
MPDVSPGPFGLATKDFLQPIIGNDILGAVALIVELLRPRTHDLKKRNIQIEEIPNATGQNPIRARVLGSKTHRVQP